MNYLKNLLNLHADEEERSAVIQNVSKNISFKGANLWILACAILIASIGLNVNSTAVIIGAMLISPLMGPIVGAGFSLATYDFNLLKKSAKNLLVATIVSLTVSSLYFYLSPFKDAQSELLARTSPTIYDVMIAFFGGIVGAISMTRKEKGNPIPGVAIATALMPPLCTAGFGIATFNLQYLLGALYLYSINCFFIGIATFLIIKYLKYRPVVTDNKSYDKKLRYAITVMILVMTIPSFYLAYNLLNEKKFTQNVEKFLNSEFYNNGYTVIYKKVNYSTKKKTIELAFLSKQFDSLEIKQFNKRLSNFGIENTQLIIKQNTSDLKAEILSEINKRSTNVSEKDLQINLLNNELKAYKFENNDLKKEVEILFPEIEELSMGKVKTYHTKDSVSTTTLILYKSATTTDKERLSNWLKTKLNDTNLKVVNEQ